MLSSLRDLGGVLEVLDIPVSCSDPRGRSLTTKLLSMPQAPWLGGLDTPNLHRAVAILEKGPINTAYNPSSWGNLKELTSPTKTLISQALKQIETWNKKHLKAYCFTIIFHLNLGKNYNNKQLNVHYTHMCFPSLLPGLHGFPGLEGIGH